MSAGLPRIDGGARRGLLDPLRAIGAAVRLGLATRLRLRGRYWAWRWETAFGRGVPRKGEMIRAGYDYLVWTARMRRMR